MIRAQVKNELKRISKVLNIRMKGKTPKSKTKIKMGKTSCQRCHAWEKTRRSFGKGGKACLSDILHKVEISANEKQDDDDDDDNDNDSSLTRLVV
jgi:hypothetical protein